MATGESSVVRIVNLDDSFTEETLKNFIVIMCRPEGDVKKIYLKRDERINTFYGYVVFQNSYDAIKMTQALNEYIHISNKLEVELIGPNLKYRIYGKDKDASHLQKTGAVSRSRPILNKLPRPHSILDRFMSLRLHANRHQSTANGHQSTANRKRPRSVSNIHRGNIKRVANGGTPKTVHSKYIPFSMRNRTTVTNSLPGQSFQNDSNMD